MQDSKIQYPAIELNDIKPLLEIDDYSLYYFLGLLGLCIILISGILFLLYKWYINRNIFNIRVEHYKCLKEIDFSNSKDSAYAVTFYGATFKDDSQRHKEMFDNISHRLESYKYKKNVPELDKETLSYIELYKEMIDV